MMNTEVERLAELLSKHHKSEEQQLRIEGVELDDITLREFDERVRAVYGRVCGIDEAGRGPMAGAVYAAAVILDPEKPINGLNDSKKLTEKKRERLYDEIIANAKAYCVAFATVEEIEATDILSADLLAMKRAYDGMGEKAGMIIVDGDVLPDIDGEIKCLKKGDARSEAVAAASILAKVSRDRYMKEQALLYPQYGFEKHKGYGTKAHIDAVDTYGLCPIHRASFFRKHFEKNEQK